MPSSDFVPKFGQVVEWGNGDVCLFLNREGPSHFNVLWLAFNYMPVNTPQFGRMNGLYPDHAMSGYTLLLDVPE